MFFSIRVTRESDILKSEKERKIYIEQDTLDIETITSIMLKLDFGWVWYSSSIADLANPPKFSGLQHHKLITIPKDRNLGKFNWFFSQGLSRLKSRSGRAWFLCGSSEKESVLPRTLRLLKLFILKWL